MQNESSGYVFTHACLRKGPSDNWMLNKVSEEIELLGHNAIIIKTDGENAIVAVQKELIKRRDKQTIPQNPPAYNPQSNGAVEKAVQDADAQLRCLKIGLEEKSAPKSRPDGPYYCG